MLFTVPRFAVDNIFLVQSNYSIGGYGMEIRDDNFYVVQTWMTTRLELKGLEKEVFAIIYGFSQDGEHDFHGSLNYLSQLTGYTKNRICTALAALTELHYIEKTSEIIKHIKKCSYKVNPIIIETHDRPKDLDARPKDLDALPQELDEDRPKDLDVYKRDIKNNKNKKDKKENSHLIPPPSIQKVVDLYNDTCTNLPKVRFISNSRKRAIQNILKTYPIDILEQAFIIANKTPFLIGDNDKGWKADLDFMLREPKLNSILEGKYANNSTHTQKSKIKNLPCNRNVRSVAVDKEEEAEVRKILQERGGRIVY